MIALVHPVGGDVLCYNALAAAWPGDGKIVGVRHPEAEQGNTRYRSVPEIAELYRRALIDALGAPPAIVGGWSFGGAVAQEMARQWEQEGGEPSGIVVIDSPLPEGVWAVRARAIIDTVDDAESEDRLGRLIADPGFQTIFDAQHGIERLRRLVDADTADRLLRIHAANALALARHAPRAIRAPLRYALALRSNNAKNVEEALNRLAGLAAGPVTALGFDSDHFSIMRAPAIQGVAGFLGVASMRLERAAPMMAE